MYYKVKKLTKQIIAIIVPNQYERVMDYGHAVWYANSGGWTEKSCSYTKKD